MPSAHGLDVYLTHCSTPYAERHITPETAAFRNPFCIPAQRVIVRRRLPTHRFEIAHLTLHAGFSFAMSQANALHIRVMVGSKDGVAIWDQVLIGGEIEKIRVKGYLLWGPTVLPTVVEKPASGQQLGDRESAIPELVSHILNVAVMRGRASGKGFRKLWMVEREKFEKVSKERSVWLRDTEFQRSPGCNGRALKFKFQVVGQDSDSGQPARRTLGVADEEKANPAVSSSDPAPRSASSDVETRVEECDSERKPSQVAETPPLSSPTTAPVLSGSFQAPATPVHDLKWLIELFLPTYREKLPSTADAKDSKTLEHPKIANKVTGRSLTGHDSNPDRKGSNQSSTAAGNADVAVDGLSTAGTTPASQVPAKLTDAAGRAIEKLKRLSFQDIAQSSARMISAPSAEPVLCTLPLRSESSGPAASDFVDLTPPTAKEVLTELRKEAADLAERAIIPQSQPHLTKIFYHSTTASTQVHDGTTLRSSVATKSGNIKAEPESMMYTADTSVLGKRKVSAIEEAEEELRDQLAEIELREKKIAVRRKLRELGQQKREWDEMLGS
ncbi:hypothetical protein LTS09_011388 [Friedmanniomyces endolithicus]|nr:hypothetical protein LTS09_011388 [Friedmanniomyces endolithicus]